MTKHITLSADLIRRARSEGRTSLRETEGKELLRNFGIKVPRSVFAAHATDAEIMSRTLTAPFAVKVVSSDILHKSDVGGVSLNLGSSVAVRRAVCKMAQEPGIATAKIDGWLVEEMVPCGHEIVVGGLRDPQFGPMIMVGLGGVFIEVLKDVAFRICPASEADAYAMLQELKGYSLLEGTRGQDGVDIDALVQLILSVGGRNGLLLSLADEIEQIDLNPVFASSNGLIAADARIILSSATFPSERRDQPASAVESFRPLFEPKTVAVLGASTRNTAIANTFIRRLTSFGFAGKIYPIHPKANIVEGLSAYPSLAQTPMEVDYAYVAIGADRIPEALKQANGRCRIAQVISSGFGEVSEGKALQEELIAAARAGGVRVLGPNCLGTYSPRGGLTFPNDAPREVGRIGVVSQSGGLSTDIIKRGQWRGLRFSGLVTIGNSADIKPHELVEYYLDDPQTAAIGIYLEDIKEGRAFFDLLRSSRMIKPVVILKGGRSEQGRIAAASHTGALAGNSVAWKALTAQTAVAMVSTVDDFIDALLALQCFDLRCDRPTRSIALFGNGGGSSVIGSDIFADVGLEIAPFSTAARKPLDAMGLPPGTSVANPIDTPVRTLQEKDGWIAGEILDVVYEYARPDAIAMHLNLAAFAGRGSVDPIENLFEVVEQTQKKWAGVAHFALALRTDGSSELDNKRRDYREKARAINVPVFDEIPAMARALATIGHLEHRLAVKS